jgi:hypothetical protein
LAVSRETAPQQQGLNMISTIVTFIDRAAMNFIVVLGAIPMLAIAAGGMIH